MVGKLHSVLCATFLYTLLQLPHGGQTAEREPELTLGLAYPVDDIVSSNLEHARNRTPVYIPGKCSKNEILYPGDHDNDWVCDCRPGYVYYPQDDACYGLYTQGFCQPGQYVDLERSTMLIKCTNNTCTGANMVPFREQCAELHHHHKLCPVVNRKRFIVAVNTTSLELDCIEGSNKPVKNRIEVDDATGAIPFAGAMLCSNGTKATYIGQCDHQP